MTQRRIFISVAEPSADAHAARLVAHAAEHHPHWRFSGLTGPALRSAGVATVFDFAQHAAMIGGVVKLVGAARRALGAAEQAWRQSRPDLVVVMDSSALHLPMARRAKRCGLRVLYYIAPQTWASRAWRNRDLARHVDHVACIVPFEQAYFRARGVNATFVGHPLFESLPADRGSAPERPSAPTTPTLLLAPGSRQGVIRALLPKQLEVVRRMAAGGVEVRVLVSAASEAAARLITSMLAAAKTIPTRPEVTTDLDAGVRAADLVLTASGTATLHIAAYRKPMVVLYDAGRWLYWPWRLGGGLAITLPHLSMVNILGAARITPEFMPFVRDTTEIASVAAQLLYDARWRQLMVRQIDAVTAPLEHSRASQRVSELMAELLGESATGGAPAA